MPAPESLVLVRGVAREVVIFHRQTSDAFSEFWEGRRSNLFGIALSFSVNPSC